MKPKLPRNAPVSETEYITWTNYLTDPMVGVYGQDVSLAAYLAESEAGADRYDIDSGSLSDSFDTVKDYLTTETAEQANVQGGGYGSPGSRVGPGRGSVVPPWLLIAVAVWWFYK